jgi:hypothetical protein
VTNDQIKQAKAINILNYHEPYIIRRVGKSYFLKDHNSLTINNGLWYWHSWGIGGRNMEDYLIKVRGFGLLEAVRHLTNHSIPYNVIANQPSERPFTLPAPINVSIPPLAQSRRFS